MVEPNWSILNGRIQMVDPNWSFERNGRDEKWSEREIVGGYMGEKRNKGSEI